MSARGRPVLGAFGGLLFGLALALLLLTTSAIPLNSILVVVLPVLFLVLGIVLAFVAPFGSRGRPASCRSHPRSSVGAP